MLSATPNSPTLRIAIYRSSSIGDVVLATSCMTLLNQLNIPTQVYWIGRQPALNLITQAFPSIIPVEVKKDESLGAPENLTEIINDVHLIIDLQKTLRSHFVCNTISKFCSAPIFTWNKESTRRSKLILKSRLMGRSKKLSDAALRPKKFQYQMMQAALIKGLEHHLPIEQRDTIHQPSPPQLPTAHDTGELPWQKELRFGTWVAIAPGASHPTKQAPIEIFQAILQELRKLTTDGSFENGIGLVMLGDENDRRTTLDLIDRLNWPWATLNLAGKLSLWESALALQEANHLLSNDSSLAHISEAVNTSVSVLFGPTIESFGFAPRMPESAAFSSRIGCRPCSKHGKTPCRFDDLLCFRNIDPRQVAQQLLTASSNNHQKADES